MHKLFIQLCLEFKKKMPKSWHWIPAVKLHRNISGLGPNFAEQMSVHFKNVCISLFVDGLL